MPRLSRVVNSARTAKTRARTIMAGTLWHSRVFRPFTSDRIAFPGMLRIQVLSCYRQAIVSDGQGKPELPPRLRRTLELVYNVEGVVAVRVWQWPGRVAVGVRGGATTVPAELIRRVEAAVAAMREPDEAWDFGILDERHQAP